MRQDGSRFVSKDPATQAYETKPRNTLKGELKRRGLPYTQLAEELTAIGAKETDRNLNNKISRSGFSAAFLIQCLEVIECKTLHLDLG